MSVKDTAKRLYIRIVDRAGEQFRGFAPPNEGWITTMRKALGMSGPQLARRTGVTKAAIYQAERKELAGEITIKQMEKLASALGGRFVYAIIPENGDISDIVRVQAEAKASSFVKRASVHMALEKQSLSNDLNKQEINRLAEKLAYEMPSDFWDKA